METDLRAEFRGCESFARVSAEVAAKILLDSRQVLEPLGEPRRHPDSDQVLVPVAETEPPAHLEECVVGSGHSCEVAADESFQGQTARQGISTDSDDGLRSVAVVESFVGLAVVDDEIEVVEDLSQFGANLVERYNGVLGVLRLDGGFFVPEHLQFLLER